MVVVLVVVVAVLLIVGGVLAARRRPVSDGAAPGFDPVRPDPDPPSEA